MSTEKLALVQHVFKSWTKGWGAGSKIKLLDTTASAAYVYAAVGATANTTALVCLFQDVQVLHTYWTLIHTHYVALQLSREYMYYNMKIQKEDGQISHGINDSTVSNSWNTFEHSFGSKNQVSSIAQQT